MESNFQLRVLLEERAALVSQIEALELRNARTPATVDEDELRNLQTAVARKDEAIGKVTDVDFYFYEKKQEGR